MAKNALLRRGVGSTSRARFDLAVQQIIQHCYARGGEVRLLPQTDFLSVPEGENLCLLWQAHVIA